MAGIARVVLVASIALVGCTGLEQFPETSKDYAADLPGLDPDYDKALKQIYADGVTADIQKRIRNQLIEQRMAVVDVHFRNFVTGLAKDNASVDFGVSVVGVGVGAAGSLVSETASQILSAVSGGLEGTQAAYNKSALFDKTLPALVAQMRASRKAIASQIFQRWNLDIQKYPLWVARRDLEAYQFAGSLPGAVLATSADAKVKDQQATEIILKAITPEAVTKEAFKNRADIRASVDKLDKNKAQALIELIVAKFPTMRTFVDAQYPDATRAGDTDGSKARLLLRRLVNETAVTPDAVETWRSAINSL